MKITNQEKVNISYIFISAYENIVNLIKPIHNSLSNLLKGFSDNNSELILSMYKIYKEKFKEKNTLKMKVTHKLLLDVNVFSEKDLEILIMLSKIRNNIGHESLNIFINETITYEYFKLPELLSLYKKLYNKFSEISEKEDSYQSTQNFNKYKLDYLNLISLISYLLNDLKFDELKKILN